MQIVENHFTFVATPEKGAVSAILFKPPESTHLLVLGHGASTNLEHPTMRSIALALAEVNIATVRYNFPYSEHHTGRNSDEVCIDTVRAAVAAVERRHPEHSLLAGGHSFGGRMTSTAQSKVPLTGVKGLIFFSFPLHPPDRPGTERAEHLRKIKVPMLFLSGTRDKLAEPDLLEPVCQEMGKRASLHWLETADHSYKTQKRRRAGSEDVFSEMARVTREWITSRKSLH